MSSMSNLTYQAPRDFTLVAVEPVEDGTFNTRIALSDGTTWSEPGMPSYDAALGYGSAVAAEYNMCRGHIGRRLGRVGHWERVS